MRVPNFIAGSPSLAARRVAVLLAAIAVTATAGCDSSRSNPEAADPTRNGEPRAPTVYAVNYPLAWMAERIGGASIAVVFPVPGDTDPAHWQPTPEDVADFQRADRILLNGAGYAVWTRFASLSTLKLVDTTERASERFVSAGAVMHTHGPEGDSDQGDHDHGDVASHTWLDPTIAATQAAAVASALGDLVPSRRSEYDARLALLQDELRSLHERLADAFTGFGERGVLYSHPVYQYLDARYALQGRSVTWEPDETPAEREWQRIAALQSERPATVMLFEGEPQPETAARLRGHGILPIVFEHCGNVPEDGDYLDAMGRNLERLQGAP